MLDFGAPGPVGRHVNRYADTSYRLDLYQPSEFVFTENIFHNPLNVFAWFSSLSIRVGNGSNHHALILNDGELFGAYYASISRTSTNAKRNKTDQARMVLLQQLLTAKLNCAAFGCTGSVQTLIFNADNAFASGSLLMGFYTSQLDAFNNSGDTLVIPNLGPATPKTSQSIANIIFWDAP